MRPGRSNGSVQNSGVPEVCTPPNLRVVWVAVYLFGMAQRFPRRLENEHKRALAAVHHVPDDSTILRVFRFAGAREQHAGGLPRNLI